MSAKRSRKPLAKCDSNIQPPAKKAKHKSPRKASNLIDATEPILHDPAAFQSIQGAEHLTESRVPEETSLTPAAFFGLFWDDSIIEHLVCVTNAYAREKKATKQQWRYPISLSELRIFLGITILMGITRLGRVSRYWSDGILSVRSSMSYHRYCQVKCFIHISMPEDTTSSPRSKWWRKLEPLSSHLRHKSQAFYQPGTHLSIDEMMVSFSGRSFHTVRIPSKPIPIGYKVIALCSMGYTIDWMLTLRTESFAKLTKLPNLSLTSSAVMQLCRSLDPYQYQFIIYMDNGFSTAPLFRKLREKNIGPCGTTRVNRIEYPAHLEQHALTEWNTIDGCSIDGVLCFRWMDNNIVRMLTTVHPWNEVTRSMRQRPRKTSTNATVVRKAFGDKERAAFFIPTAIDDYNHYMGGVDIADQRRAGMLNHIHNTGIGVANN